MGAPTAVWSVTSLNDSDPEVPLPGEVWRRVPGLPMYEVSVYGRVRSWWAASGPRVMTAHVCDRGYPVVGLTARDHRRSARDVHTLVADAFLVWPRQPSQQVRHLDGNRLDPRLWNLAIGSARQNAADRLRHGHHNTTWTHCFRGHEFTAENTYTQPGTKHRQCRACRRLTTAARANRPDGALPPRAIRTAAIAADTGPRLVVAQRYGVTVRTVDRIRSAQRKGQTL